MPVLKIFASQEQVAARLSRARLIERYDAFVVVEAEPRVAKRLAEDIPLEDISQEYRLKLSGRSVDPLHARAAGGRKKALSSKAPDGRAHHYIVQFIGPIKRSWLNAVKREGGELRQPYGGFAYVVRANGKSVERLRALRAVRWIGHLPHADRIASVLREKDDSGARALAPRRRVLPSVLSVQLFGPEDAASVARAAKRIGCRVLSQDAAALLLVLEVSSKSAEKKRQVRALSAVHGVRYIRERPVRRISNDVATGLMGNAWPALRESGPRLTGEGEVIAVCDTGLDTGDPLDIHPDFAGRVQAIKSYPIASDWAAYVTNPGANDGAADLDSGHGTHVAGSVLGDGSALPGAPKPIRGHAHKARLVFQAIEQEMKWKPHAPKELRSERYALSGIPTNLKPLFQYAYDQGARIHSNSWGGGDPGSYDDQCSQFDAFVWQHKDFCFVIAAGNDGSDADGDGVINPGSVSSPGTAKNGITVGASESSRAEFAAQRYGKWWPDDFPSAPFKADGMADDAEQIVAFSSRGPTKDGRIKPDVVAPGTFILSTRSSRLAPNNFAWSAYPASKRYFYMGGTSMATPLTAGAVALLREYLRTKRKIAAPSAALLKALLIAGARRVGSSAAKAATLDSDQGYGRVDLTRSLRAVRASVEGAALETGEQTTGTIRVTRAASTLRVVLAYSDYPGPKLVNNLNLIVTDPSGKTYVGNQPAGTATLSMDSRNNVELVEIRAAVKGVYGYRVVASNVASGPQDFALAAVSL